MSATVESLGYGMFRVGCLLDVGCGLLEAGEIDITIDAEGVARRTDTHQLCEARFVAGPIAGWGSFDQDSNGGHWELFGCVVTKDQLNALASQGGFQQAVSNFRCAEDSLLGISADHQ